MEAYVLWLGRGRHDDDLRADGRRTFREGGVMSAAQRILADHGKETDDALVLVVRYVGPEA